MNKFLNEFKVIYQYRYLIWILSLKELKVRYRGSALGFLWSLMNPLLLLIIYTFMFVVIFKNTAKAYPVYFFCGILPFTWFQSSIIEGTSSITNAGSFVTKSTFPSEVIVIVRVVANLINYALAVPVLFVFLFIWHIKIGFPLLIFPLVIICQFFLSSGIALFLATLQVFYRDTIQIVTNLMTFLFFSIPIMYFSSQIPPKLRHLVYLNPVAYLMKNYQDIFYSNMFPRLPFFILLIIISILAYILGRAFFYSKKDEFAELV